VQNAKESLTGRVQIRHLSENPVGALLPPPGYMFAKRMTDFALVVATLPVTLPLLLAGWIAVKAEGSGGAFYSQVRVGYRGRTFAMHKLRTMRNAVGAAVTASSDSRITSVGRVLRRYHIDELPQILNILKGEMSWIGPRPDVTERLAEYRKAIPFFAYRHVVRPGITGWAQVHQGYAESIDEISRKLEYDFFYIRNISFWLDILILMKSLRTVIRGTGAR
jgi:lipopolysaccharide/colanic/teichoic acid biosynthesis glycosyltransferase